MTDKLVDDLKRALGDAYTIERELTGGGMSRVFVAKEHALGREVVIKVLPPDLAAGVNRDRFRREVQLAARLSHPYIVPLLHAGEHGELLWFTMPFIPGESLRTVLQRQGPLPLPEVVKLLRDVVEALAYAHSRGVVHRDIKPANIMYDGQHAVVTDFGVAKALNASLAIGGPGHTTSGMAIGTPAYMAPEQLAADPDADQRVDIYAVGLLAYELLSGVSPFAAPSPTATMTAQLTRVPEPLHQLRSDVPPAFSELVQRCLAKSPDDRPRDAQAVLADLDRISGALAADAHRGEGSGVTRTTHAPSLPLLLATIGVLALVVGGFWWTQRGSIKAVNPDSATATRLGGDSADLGTPLPNKVMTHKDSLELLEALQSQLKQVDPKYQKKAGPKPAMADSLALATETREIDSLVRVRLNDAYRSGAPASGVPPVAPAIPPSPIVPNVTSIAAPAGARHLAIVLPPTRRADTLLQPLQRRAAADLLQRISRTGQWATIAIDSSGEMGRGMFSGTGADMMVFLMFRRDSADSVKLLVTVRSTAPGTNFSYRAITSDPVYRPTSTTPFNGTLRDASRLLNQLRVLPPGTPWPLDMGRGGPNVFGPPNGGRGNRGDRNFSPAQMDSLRRNLRGRRDSTPE